MRQEEVVEKVEPPKPIETPTRIVYPVLFAIFPVLSIYSANLAVIPLAMIVRPIMVISLAAIALWLIFGLIFRSISRGAVASSALVSMSLLFTKIQALSHRFYALPEQEIWIWLALTILIAGILIWKFQWHKVANFLSIVLVGTSIAQIVYGYYRASTTRPDPQATLGKSGQTITSRPDIIYVILDGYGRSDALQRSFGFNNGWFVNNLEKRGFYVAKDSKANYCQTELSVGSSLNLDYIQSLLTKVGPQDKDRRPLGDIIDNNAAAQYLRSKGYIFSAITTGFPPLSFDKADINLRSKSGMSMIEVALMQMTPLSKDSAVTRSMYIERRESLSSAFDAISTLGVKNVKPRFVVAHILAPHPPFVFDGNGGPIRQKGQYGFWDGSDYIENVSNAADYSQGYVGQAEYVGKRMIAAIDSVLSGSGEKPVILIQGDHGSKLRLDQNSLERTDLNECFPNLSAFYVPDSIRKNLYPSITPVNSFRIVFNGLFNDDFKLKEDRSWYSTFPLPYKFTDVTNQIADHVKMPTLPLTP